MQSFDTGMLSYGAGAIGYLLLCIGFISRWRNRQNAGWQLGAALTALIWSGYASWKAGMGAVSVTAGIEILELIRDLAWLAFLRIILDYANNTEVHETCSSDSRTPSDTLGYIHWLKTSGIVLPPLLIIVILLRSLIGEQSSFSQPLSLLVQTGFVCVSVLGLVMVEQLFRNARIESRWGIKYLCFGLGGMFAFDFFLYADGLLFGHINLDLWDARGAVNALLIPLLAVAVNRNPQWSLDVFVSRRMAFHTASLLATGIYLTIMAIAGYWIQLHGGAWSGVLQVLFFFGAVLVLMIVLFSGQVRASLKVFLNKHFFHYKYDYREEWLRFTGTLSQHSELGTPLRVILAMRTLVESPGGILWVREADAGFAIKGEQNLHCDHRRPLEASHSLAQFVEESGWVVDIDEYNNTPDVYGDLVLPDWLLAIPVRFIVPLFHDEQLIGLLALEQPRTHIDLNWEDTDLLKTAARQAASYLSQSEAERALSLARQFEAYNRMSTFVVHDLRNLVAQQTLMISNAERHKHKPEFIDDMVATIGNSINKMNRLLGQMRAGAKPGSNTALDLNRQIQLAIDSKSGNSPTPRFESAQQSVLILANKDQLLANLGHLIQNAQDATPDEGSITIRLHTEQNTAIVDIIDSGSGMSTDFIANELFKPFATTKGHSGMGIGAYEARMFARSSGGDLTASSEPGKGTHMQLKLPMNAVAGELS